MPRRTTTRSPADATETPCLIVRHGCMLVQLAVLLPPGATNSVAADAHAGAAPSATAALARQPASRTPRRTLFESFDIPNLRFMPSHAKGLGAANAASLLPPVAEVNRQRESARSISHLGLILDRFRGCLIFAGRLPGHAGSHDRTPNPPLRRDSQSWHVRSSQSAPPAPVGS